MAPVHIIVDMSAMKAHIYTITLIMSDADKKQQLFLPTWTPGSYLIREFAQHIVSIKAWEHNQEIDISKINKNTFEVNNNTNNIIINYEVYAFDSSIRAAFIDDQQAFFNGSSLFLCPIQKENSEFIITIKNPHQDSPKIWEVATSMPVLDVDNQGFGSYKAMTYEELIDYPVQIGNLLTLSFEASGIKHDLVLVGDIRPFDHERLIKDLRALCEKQNRLFGTIFNKYLFIARFEEGAHGGLEHRNSSMLLATPYALPRRKLEEPDSAYCNFLSLCSHEYFHAWNIKRLRPKNFLRYNLQEESYTTMLWLFEGITSYYDDYILRKSNIISAENYLNIIAKNYTKLLRNRGRFIQSLAQSSFDTWIKFYRPNENSQNSTVSYYLKGSFVGLLLDLMIRSHSHNKKSLDDLMKEAFMRHGAEGINEKEFFELFKNHGVSASIIDEFVANFIYGTCELPLAPYFSSFGLDVNYLADEQSIDDKTKSKAYWGMKIKFDDHHRAVINYIDSDGPAATAGLSCFDEIIAINNIKLDQHNIADLLGSINAQEIVRIALIRKKKLHFYHLSPVNNHLNLCKITLKQAPSEIEKEARISWLGQ
jgi:predicted metalloprotease with PDZ domain